MFGQLTLPHGPAEQRSAKQAVPAELGMALKQTGQCGRSIRDRQSADARPRDGIESAIKYQVRVLKCEVCDVGLHEPFLPTKSPKASSSWHRQDFGRQLRRTCHLLVVRTEGGANMG